MSLELEAVTDVGWTAGNGVVGVVAERGDLVAVASSFPLLYWPGRAFYDGHRFHHRVVLYEKSTRKRLGVLDGLRWPIHEIAIHPQGTALAVATGSYDGGWLFEGELVVWRWKEGHVVRPVEGREIVRVRWAEDDHVMVLARPPDDEQGPEPFRTVYGGVFDARWGAGGQGTLRTEPTAPEDVGFDGAIAPPGPREWVDPPPRPKIWDLGLLEGGSVLAVGDDGLAEIWDEKLARRRRLVIEGRGVQVLQVAGRTLVHAVAGDRSLLYALRRGDLALLREYDRVYLMSAGGGHLLGRDTSRDKPRRDVVLDVRGEPVASADLGAFDVFNHALRLDGDLCFLRGTGDQPHQRKVLSRVKLGAGGLGTQDLQPWDGDVHRMSPTGCDAGGRLVFGFYDHHPQPGRGDSWIVGPGWKLRVPFPPVALAASGDVVAWALLNGEIGALHASTGAVIARASAEADGVNTAATSMRSDGDRIVIGTLDGRIFRYRLVLDPNGTVRSL